VLHGLVSRGRPCCGRPNWHYNHITDDVQPALRAELGGERLTYRQLGDRAVRVAGGLRERRVSTGERAAKY
jgi:acyl-CoA synthetase (AMP-forming)/AMP-acid ligase II